MGKGALFLLCAFGVECLYFFWFVPIVPLKIAMFVSFSLCCFGYYYMQRWVSQDKAAFYIVCKYLDDPTKADECCKELVKHYRLDK